jgi:UDP-sulfoquinovose synthase
VKILVLGGDGFLGWPTAMRLSKAGHEVMVVDNYLRRRLCLEQSVAPLFAVPDLGRRVQLWREATGLRIEARIGDVSDWSFISSVMQGFVPDALVHYAEQPAAPYSMLSRHAAALTLQNNLMTTLNVIYGVREFAPTCHIVKLGTMGEYGTPNIDIEEGWLEIEHKGRTDKFLYPRQAGSLYHTTKIMDTDMLWLYARVWNIRVTDLMQGPVYGVETYENDSHEELYSFLNYDEIFGTVLNRFIVQAVAGYPLTVYGAGGQTRGFLHINDTLNCIELAIRTPAKPGQLRIFNQFTETFSVNGLADKVASVGRQMGLSIEIKSVQNPRKEAEDHRYVAAHTGLLELGLEPHFLTDERLADIIKLVMRFKNRIDPDQFLRNIKWA